MFICQPPVERMDVRFGRYDESYGVFAQVFKTMGTVRKAGGLRIGDLFDHAEKAVQQVLQWYSVGADGIVWKFEFGGKLQVPTT